jgi:DNA invertase Pin-like site-specific DNA recombinase
MRSTTAAAPERAGAWFRVSTRDQDEANQQPQVMTWITDHGYDHAATYQIHGASARKGNKRFDTTWAQVINDFRTGKITVLVVWRLSRLDRKLAATQMIAEVVKLGGRIEFAKQQHLNDLSTMAGRISLTVEQELAFAESEEKSDRVKAKHVTLRDKGSFVGRPPWGYDIVLGDGLKTLAPNAEGREWIPQIFRKMATGGSRHKVAKMLMDAGLKTKNGRGDWSEQTIGGMIKNPAYYGFPRNNGTLEVEALVSASEWQAANSAMRDRAAWRGREATVYEKPLLKPLCGHCQETTGKPSPMYRIPLRTFYYRCKRYETGSCGSPMVPCEELDDLVTEAMLADQTPKLDEVFVPGDDHADEIAKIDEKMQAAMLAHDYEKVVELGKEAERLAALPSKPARWEFRYNDKTVSSHFAALDLQGRREFLTEYGIVARRVTGEDGSKHVEFTMVHKSLLAEMQPA